MPKAIRDAYGEALLKYGVPQKDVLVLDADVSGSTKSILFGKEAPERFFNVGIAENNMTAMAAGMATIGKNVFINTFASFLSTIGLCASKALISYAKLNVKLAGTYSGMSDAYDGPSHHALEDIAIMRTLPNFTVITVCDEVQTDLITKYLIEKHNGPVYLRLSRESSPVIYKTDEIFEIGKGKVLKEGTDATIISMGIMVSKSLEAAEILKAKGINVRVVDMFTVKPIDRELIYKCAKETGAIVVSEEHNVMGGLYSAVSEVIVQGDTFVPMEVVGTMDTHAETGKYNLLLEKYGLSTDNIVKKVEVAISRKK